MENFRGGNRTTFFNDDVNVISGKNASGKSRHFDAFIWCLFGKDTQDRKDFEVKNRVNGEEVHGVDCTVSIIIDIDGNEHRLTRTLHEEWVKPRGQVDRVFKGNVTLCQWDDMPISVGEFTKKVNGLIEPTLFKTLTNPEYFCSLNWKTMREQLFNIAGSVSFEEISSKYPEYAETIKNMGTVSFDDYKKQLSLKRKRLSDELKSIQPKIEQVYSMIPSEVDEEGIQAQIVEIDKKIDMILQVSNKADAERSLIESKKSSIKQEIDDLEKKIYTIYRNEVSKSQNEAVEKNIQRNNLILELKKQESNLKGLESHIKFLIDDIDKLNVSYQEKLKSQEKLRNKWYECNSKQFEGETTCPYCGSQLPDNMIENSKSEFNAIKEKELQSIQEEGKNRKLELEKLEEKIKETNNDLSISNDNIKQIKNNISRLNDELSRLPYIEPKKVIVEEIAECVALQKEIEAKWEQINNIVYTDTEIDVECKNKLISERDELKKHLLNKEIRTKMLDEITSLQNNAKELSQKIADVEKEEYSCCNISKLLINANETKINAFFDIIKFKLYDLTVEGNVVETCTPIVNGVNYYSANKADRINAGLDIIKALSKFYGIECPIFIDNRESINDIITMDNQIINLIVTNDNLKINDNE